MPAWTSYIALRLDQQPADAGTLLPLLTVPHLYDLTPESQQAMMARLRLFVRVYVLVGRFEPAVFGLSERFVREDAANRRREEARLVDSEVAADSSTEAEEKEEQVAESAMHESDVRDDNVRHEQPLDVELMSALAQTASTQFNFPDSVAPPSSHHAVSAAARLVFLDPTSAENWQLMADSAEGREVERRRCGGDCDAGWKAIIHCRQRQYELLQEQTLQPSLWPQDIAADRSVVAANSVACLLSSAYCMAHLQDGDEEERQQRSTSITSTLESIPTDSLTTPALRWLRGRCKARLAVHDGDRVQAMKHYQQCVEVSDEELSDSLPAAAIWQEMSEVLHPQGSELALQSGLRWLDHKGDVDSRPLRAAARSSLVLSLLELYERTGEFGKGAELLRAEYVFLSSQQPDSTSAALSLTVLLCDFAERAASSRAAYLKEVKALQPLWQQWENELIAEPTKRWEEPMPARTRWHLGQLAAYQKDWAAALDHLQAVEDGSVLTSDAYKQALVEAHKRVREAAQANEEQKA